MKLLPAQTLSHLGRVRWSLPAHPFWRILLAFFWEECKTFQLSTKPSKPIDLLTMQLGIVIVVFVFHKGSSQQEIFKQQNQELELHKSPLLACSKVNLVDVVMVSTFLSSKANQIWPRSLGTSSRICDLPGKHFTFHLNSLHVMSLNIYHFIRTKLCTTWWINIPCITILNPSQVVQHRLSCTRKCENFHGGFGWHFIWRKVEKSSTDTIFAWIGGVLKYFCSTPID